MMMKIIRIHVEGDSFSFFRLVFPNYYFYMPSYRKFCQRETFGFVFVVVDRSGQRRWKAERPFVTRVGSDEG